MLYRVVETDNFGGDYPDESFAVEPLLPEKEAKAVALIINRYWCRSDHDSRYWKVVDENYTLQPGFEP